MQIAENSFKTAVIKVERKRIFKSRMDPLHRFNHERIEFITDLIRNDMFMKRTNFSVPAHEQKFRKKLCFSN